MLDRYPVTDDSPKRDLYANWRVQYCFCTFLLQMKHGQYDKAAVTLDSAAYYEVIDGNIPANVNLLMRYSSQLANARGQHAEALVYADSTLRMSAKIDDVAVIGALEERTEALRGLGRYDEALADHERLTELSVPLATFLKIGSLVQLLRIAVPGNNGAQTLLPLLHGGNVQIDSFRHKLSLRQMR